MARAPPSVDLRLCDAHRSRAADAHAHAHARARFRWESGPFWLARACREGKGDSMGDLPFDPLAFKAQQRAQWSAVAQGWRRRWTTFERDAQPLSDRLMELAHIDLGQRVLDVATGIGEPALTAARRVGPAGSVVASDQAPPMLAVGRGR